MTKYEELNIHIPVTRAFEDNGERFIYGYCAIFDSPDALGTVITRELVEGNMERLRKYPTLRFMHKEPLGQIVFDTEIKGYRTFTDSHGFHVLARIFSIKDEEWKMIKEGNWGFSYGLKPTKTEMREICMENGQCQVCEHFISGILYEVSVVDTPAHPESSVNTIQRSLTYVKPNQKSIEQPQPTWGFRSMIERMCSQTEEPDLKVKMRRHQQANPPFLKYRDKIEHILTNQEIQERIKKEKEVKQK